MQTIRASDGLKSRGTERQSERVRERQSAWWCWFGKGGRCVRECERWRELSVLRVEEVEEGEVRLETACACD